jgi:hypothetical protein
MKKTQITEGTGALDNPESATQKAEEIAGTL